ncbi:ATP-binding protein [Aquihabitans daechungensis]|uniref:ATP-binding protein n=1 Tax=Aquihabitans daechungensis TaxID=1052257 RepID=UPI003BA0B901
MSSDAAASGDVVELELPARPEVVSVARLVIGALVAADPLFDEERSADLRLAVSEACTNAIQAEMAGRRDEPPDPDAEPIVMRCVLADGQIEVAITDHGGGFDPNGLEAHPEVTSPDRLNYEGGLGIPLITMLADHLEFQPTDDGTTVIMRFEPREPGVRPVIGNVNGSANGSGPSAHGG